MSDNHARPCTAFAGDRIVANGPLADVAVAVRTALDAGTTQPVLTFDDATGAVVDLDLRGSAAEIVARLAEPAGSAPLPSARPTPADEVAPGPPRGRGRPALGVVAREVTLLPRHWEWLAAQRGGASAALRRLVDEARRADGGQGRARTGRDAAYRFMSAMAGDLPGFEEATRALFAGDDDRFRQQTAAWPVDVRDYAQRLVRGAEAASGQKTESLR
jgi:hypothetical protein